MKALICTVLLLSYAVCSRAHDSHLDVDHCDVQFDGSISMTDAQLEVELAYGKHLLIDPMHNAYIDNQPVDLTPQQQQWVTDYYQGFYQAVPIAAEVAAEAIQLADTAVTEVLTELFEDPDFANDISHKLAKLNQNIQQKFYADDGRIHLQSIRFEQGNFVDQAWEDEIQGMIEDYVIASLGRLMLTLGSQVLAGNETDLTQRLQHMGKDIEKRITAQAKHIEHKAQQVCHMLHKVDDAENKLQHKIPALSKLDILSVHAHQHLM